MGETATGFFEYSFEGRDRFCGYALVTQTNWFLIVSQDTRETMQIAAANMKYTLAFNILFLLLGTAFLVYFSNQISSPVTQNLVRLNSAVSQAAEAFIIIDEKQNLQFYNIAAVQLIEGTPEMNRPCKIGNLDKGELISIIDSVTEKGHWNGKIGETMDLTVTPVNDSQSKSTSFLLIGRDMTTEIQLQQQIIQSQRMDAIGTLTSGISHDFNNILTGILGYIDLSLMSLDDRENLEAYILEIQNASVRAVDLISHIMAYSHKNDHKVKHISLKYIVKDTLKLVHASLPATITIQEFYESSSPILADPTAIHQLIMNLCINAGYAMKKRGGNLDVELRELKGSEVRKTHSEATEKSYLCLTIRDSGTGIKPEILEKIFDPFFTTKPQGEGTGIGLPTVHNIVRNLEGFISVESETGKGTAFFIYFPVSNFDEETGNEQIGTDFPGGSEHILVIDDEKVITNSTKSRLEKLGYTVSTYNDSLKGLDAFIKAPQNYDLILTDYTMPQMVGSFLIKEARKIREDIPVIISSGDLSISGEIQDMKNVLFLKKPLLTQELTMNIRKILDKK